VSAKRVLVVDDDPPIRETIERNLQRWGYEVAVAESAEAALSKVHVYDPGLVITDVRMSGMTGLELLAKLRESAPDIDVIVMTAYEDMRTAITAMRAGAFEYLVKPLDLDQIELVVQRCFTDRVARRRAARQAELDRDSAEQYTLSQLVGRNPRMIDVYKKVGAVAESRAPVLVRGETGTGKELVARAVHFNSPAASEPFVAVNCTAVPETLLESELFGHMRGSFTGATNDRKGRFELAGSGTVFLDEIGDTSPSFQTKLLRVLQEREFFPVGAERPRKSDARVVAATHRNLEELVAKGSFREDLYYRLRVVEIHVPPLRDRRDDIPLLADYMLRRSAAEMHGGAKSLTADALRRLVEHDWPGNVRELENTLTRAMLLARGSTISADDLSLASAHVSPSHSERLAGDADWTLRSVEREHVQRVLDHTRGNKRKAARLMGVSRSRLDRLLDKHGLPTRPSESHIEAAGPITPAVAKHGRDDRTTT
jgi:DNA-binding NtrC family response regulator